MSTIRTSYYSRQDKVVAALALLERIREKWPDDPVMAHVTTMLGPVVQQMVAGYGGLDTRPATGDVRSADDARDAASRAADYHFKAILASAAHRDAWEAAARLSRVLTHDGLGWIHDSYAGQSLRTHEVLKRWAEMEDDIEICQARVFVDQLASAQETFERKIAERGAQVAGRPEILETLTPAFDRALRAALLLVEQRPDDAARTFVLEPFLRLSRRRGHAPSSPEPTPQG